MAKQKTTKRTTTKRTITEPIDLKIKRLNELYVNNGDKEEIKKLKAEIDFFFYGCLERL